MKITKASQLREGMKVRVVSKHHIYAYTDVATGYIFKFNDTWYLEANRFMGGVKLPSWRLTDIRGDLYTTNTIETVDDNLDIKDNSMSLYSNEDDPSKNFRDFKPLKNKRTLRDMKVGDIVIDDNDQENEALDVFTNTFVYRFFEGESQYTEMISFDHAEEIGWKLKEEGENERFKKYRLLKDLPFISKGQILKIDNDGISIIGSSQRIKNDDAQIIHNYRDNPDWFEPVD